jgi:hypothetical protein
MKSVKPLIIETLIIHIRPMEPAYSVDYDGPFDFTTLSTCQADILAKFMKRKMDYILTAGCSHHDPWGPLFLSRVKRLVIMSRDSVVKEIDVAIRAKDFDIEVARYGVDA